MTTAFLFAGQGAQTVGMGADLPADLFDRASAILGYDLRALCLRGPAERLDRTDVSQPALLVASLAALEAAAPPPPAAGAGLSLGEITALAAAEAIAFEDAVRLVKIRGEAMQAACDARAGGMNSVIGLDPEKIRAACDGAGLVGVANLNAPGQVVISGEKEALERASAACKAAGARRILPLRVAGAYHSPLMEPAVARLREALRPMQLRAPRWPVVSNVTARPYASADEIPETLARQITSTVRFEESVRWMIAQSGVRRFIEFGPGGVLSGLVRKIDPSVEVAS
jgi:[acyl-carrier-protein] S-malonyltransferase